MTIKPLHNHVFISRIARETVSKGGFLFADIVLKAPEEGTVLAVGEGLPNDDGVSYPLDVKVGDRVLFGQAVGSDIKIDGKTVLILKESDLLGVYED